MHHSQKYSSLILNSTLLDLNPLLYLILREKFGMIECNHAEFSIVASSSIRYDQRTVYM